MPDALQGWFPAFTLFIGYAAGWLSEWLQHRRASQRERDARLDARQDQLRERRATFQRQTLLDLQESLLQLVRSAAVMHHQDVMAYRKTGNWQKQLYDNEISEDFRLAHARTTMLSVRVRDDTVRDLVNTLKSHATNSGMCATQKDSELHIWEMTTTYENLNHHIGEILRSLDD